MSTHVRGVSCLTMVVVIAGLACSSFDGSEHNVGTGVSESQISRSSAEVICARGVHGANLERIAQLPKSETSVAWTALSDNKAFQCWPHAVVAIGLLGDTRSYTRLVNYVEKPNHRTTVARFASYALVPRAIGAIAGRYSEAEDASAIVRYLLGCSEVSHWNQLPLFMKDLTKERDTAAKKLALVCIEALGLTRDPKAHAFLEDIHGNSAESSDRQISAEAALDAADAIRKNIEELRKYLE